VNRFSFAHLSDLHLPLAPRPPRLRDLLSKRVFSWLSWRRSRRHIHRPEILAQLMEDVREVGAGHLLVTGDLVNLALPEEFDRARDWLAAQGGGDAVTVVPGNHDALVPVPWADGIGRWKDWMGDLAPGGGQEAFPFVKRVGDVALVGLSSAMPTAPFLAGGRIGEAQLARLEQLLQRLEAEGLFRVVLLHHPLTEGAVRRRKALWDRDRLRQVLARAGAELVLHGHSHESTLESVPGPRGPIPVVAAPSASAAPDDKGVPAGWSLIEVEPTNEAWRLTVSLRSIAADGLRFDSGERISLDVARRATPV
jgi:3',5'-cyclic AMP phosphodiesterase CpdA